MVRRARFSLLLVLVSYMAIRPGGRGDVTATHVLWSVATGAPYVYFVSENGDTVVVKAGPRPEVVARNAVNERSLASPAISNGRVFLRTDDHLIAIGR